MLLVGDITFPHWDGDPQFEPYTTYKQLDDALNRGQSLDAAERTADWEQLLIDNSDEFTGKLLLKAVDKRRADVVRFMVERGADLNFPTYLLHAAVRRGRYSAARLAFFARQDQITTRRRVLSPRPVKSP